MATRQKTVWFKRAAKFMLKVGLIFFVGSVLSVILFRWVPIPVTPLMLIRLVEQVSDGKELRLVKDWEPLSEITPSLQLAVVVCEDQEFLRHNGFNMDAIKAAFRSNSKGKKLRGASTISQQTAKNVFLWHGRNYVRKGLEAYFTVLIETFWPKERIMEVYLNVIEFGNGIYGAQAASIHYFGKDVSKLSKEESARLAVILPSPRRYKASQPGPYVARRTEWTLRQMRMWGNKLDYNSRTIPGEVE